MKQIQNLKQIYFLTTDIPLKIFVEHPYYDFSSTAISLTSIPPTEA